MMELDIDMKESEVANTISEPKVFDDDSNDSILKNKKKSNFKVVPNLESSDEESSLVLNAKRRLQRFTDSDSDTDKENDLQTKNNLLENEDQIEKANPSNTKKRIFLRDDSDSGKDSDDKQTMKNEEQQLRMKNKRNKLREKFKSLVTSRNKEGPNKGSSSESEQDKSDVTSNDFNDEGLSINNIKKDVKESMSFKPSICDPDTSDEEENENRRERPVSKFQSQRKSAKSTSPKSIRMSAKQAMENMKMIKSESNRLLREKEISLPYHRPKAISLKDIMSRRKAAVTADGKALPIKMNEEQLKQYVQMLEQRQKEIIELCKSDSDEEQVSTNASENNDHTDHDQNKENIVTELLDDNGSQLTTASIDGVHVAKNDAVKVDIEKSITVPESAENNINSEDNIEFEKELSTEDCNEPNATNANTENVSTDSIDRHDNDVSEEIVQENIVLLEQISKTCTEPDTQNLKLHYDSESHNITNGNTNVVTSDAPEEDGQKLDENDFSDGDINMEDIDKLIENAEIMNDETYNGNAKSLTLNMSPAPLNVMPKLTGAPGLIIDLDDYDSDTSKKLSGVELLKERFTYFAKLKTPEELEREKDKRLKPGTQHIKLKQELEEVIAEQRSIEWAKRLNDEKQQQLELKALRGEESDAEDDIEKIEALIEEKDVEGESSSEEGESEPEEEIDELTESKEKPRIKNPMIDDEAEESDCDNDIEDKQSDTNAEENCVNGEDNENSDNEQTSEDSSEDESEVEEQTNKTRKGRILKAFEDSDDENVDENIVKSSSIEVLVDKLNDKNEQNSVTGRKCNKDTIVAKNTSCNDMDIDTDNGSQIFKDSQDDEIQLAQRMVSTSDDMFTSQESASIVAKDKSQHDSDDNFVGTQSFSILNSNNSVKDSLANKPNMNTLSLISDTQTFDSDMEVAVVLPTGKFSQNFIPTQLSSSQQFLGQSQAIGEDVLALCTGKFYDNDFVSQSEEGKTENGIIAEAINDSFDDSWTKHGSQAKDLDALAENNDTVKDSNKPKDNDAIQHTDIKDNDAVIIKPDESNKQKSEHQNLLQSIIDELHEEEIESSKPNKYFPSNTTSMNQVKKKLVIESDDELNGDANEPRKNKKLKKRKLEQRALQISDDEEDEQSDDAEEYMSDVDDTAERIVDYDSEENEIEVKQQNPKKKHKATDLFENEAELTSEDEWVGSGDEDEADLDRMEREEGDDDTFHEGKLQRKLGQIHMRDVLDQDKREVRLIQELLFEDGDLGGGHRQRKFRWKNADDVDDTDPVTDEFGTTQEEEFESEEQWRKQRHEREVFLRQMQEQDKKEDSPNISLNRSTIIKANLTSRTMTSLLLEANKPVTKKSENIEGTTDKPLKDIPSPKKGFTLLQQNYHSSLLTRGRGALARLAALATPLAVDEDSTKVAAVAPKNQRNFVFAAVTKEEDEPKVSKRKADSKLDTPRLVKKLKTKEKQTLTRNSLLDHLRV